MNSVLKYFSAPLITPQRFPELAPQTKRNIIQEMRGTPPALGLNNTASTGDLEGENVMEALAGTAKDQSTRARS